MINIDLKQKIDDPVTVEDATRDFTSIAEQAKQNGHVYLYENGEPRIMVIDLDKEPQIEMSEDEKFEFVTQRVLRNNIEAFRELAK